MRKKRRLFAILLALCVTFTMMPLSGSGGVAHAADGTAANAVVIRTTMLDLTSTEGKYIATDRTEKTVNFTTESVTDSAEGWSWNHETKTLTLSGARIVVEGTDNVQRNCYGIFVPGDSVTIVLEEETESFVQAGDAVGEEIGGTIYSSNGIGNQYAYDGQLTICGSGRLIAKGGQVDNSNQLEGGQRTSAGIVFFAPKGIVIKENAVVEAYGGESRSSFGGAYSGGIISQMVKITDDAKITARGGAVCGFANRHSYGMRVSTDLVIDGNAIVKSYGGTVTKQGNSATEYSRSAGIHTPKISLSADACVYAFGGESRNQAEYSAGIYLDGSVKSNLSANLSDNAFLHAEGGISEHNNFGIAARPDSSRTPTLTVSENAYLEAVAKESLEYEYCKCIGIRFMDIHINGGTVIASAETQAQQGSIEAISPQPTYAEGLTPIVTAGTTETDAIKIESPDEETYAKRWVKIQTSEPKYAIAATPSEIDFGTAKAGYTQPDAKTVSITNTGNESILLDEVLQENDSKYNVSSVTIGQAIAPNETMEIFTVQPNAGLEPGEYNEKLTIKTGKGTQTAEAEVTLKFTVTRNSSSGGGGGYVPIQKPAILAGEGFQTTLSADGTKLSITAADGYEITDVLLNGVSKGSVTQLSGLKTGDKVEIKAAKKADPTDPSKPTDPTNPSADKNAKIIKGVEKTTVTLKSKLTKNKKILLSWTKSRGYKVDRFQIYRSVKKNSGYGKKAFFATGNGEVSTYLNTKNLRTGKTYYYKLRGVRIIDGQKYYTQWSNKAWRTVLH